MCLLDELRFNHLTHLNLWIRVDVRIILTNLKCGMDFVMFCFPFLVLRSSPVLFLSLVWKRKFLQGVYNEMLLYYENLYTEIYNGALLVKTALAQSTEFQKPKVHTFLSCIVYCVRMKCDPALNPTLDSALNPTHGMPQNWARNGSRHNAVNCVDSHKVAFAQCVKTHVSAAL